MRARIHSLKDQLPLAVLFVQLVATASCIGLLDYAFLALRY